MKSVRFLDEYNECERAWRVKMIFCNELGDVLLFESPFCMNLIDAYTTLLRDIEVQWQDPDEIDFVRDHLEDEIIILRNLE